MSVNVHVRIIFHSTQEIHVICPLCNPLACGTEPRYSSSRSSGFHTIDARHGVAFRYEISNDANIDTTPTGNNTNPTSQTESEH